MSALFITHFKKFQEYKTINRERERSSRLLISNIAVRANEQNLLTLVGEHVTMYALSQFHVAQADGRVRTSCRRRLLVTRHRLLAFNARGSSTLSAQKRENSCVETRVGGEKKFFFE